jgi:hypothetical protein
MDGGLGSRFSSRLRASDKEELPVYQVLHYEGGTYTLVIDLNEDNRYRVRWEEPGYLFPINFPDLQEAQHFAEGWLDMVEAGHLDVRYLTMTEEETESLLPSGKDCMGFIALTGLLGTLVLLLYLFG